MVRLGMRRNALRFDCALLKKAEALRLGFFVHSCKR